MNIDALPKILFLNEESEQMQDQRIRNKVEYDTSSDIPKKVITKKINNTIQFTQKLSSNNEINCLAYSNKLGLLISCLENEILITDFPHLEQYIATPDTSEKSLRKISAAVKFAGKIYLTPDELKFLAVNKDEFMLFDLTAQKIISTGKNENQLRHFAFVTSESFVAWNFLSNAYFYDKITGSIENPKILEGVQKCTSANIIQSHIVVCQKINVGEDDQDSKIIVFDSTASKVVNEISLRKFDNPDNYFFNYTQIISVFSIKHEKEGKFSQNDVYGLVLGYYDDYQEEPDRRYLNFVKGNIIDATSDIKIRGFQLFLSPTEDRTFYYAQNGQKIPFQVQILSTGSTKIIMIEKLEVIFVVDSTQQFSKLNLYSLQPTHEIKLQGGNYFKGACLMKNMLQAQRKSPADSNETCKMICKDFKGQFLSLYFPSKQTELTVPFPASVLVLGDNKIQRRYAIETYQSIEEYETDKIKEAISKIKSSPYIETVQNQIKVDLNKEIDLSARHLTKQVPQKKEEPVYQFVQKIKAATLFDSKPVTAPSGGLFGQISESKAGTSLFMVKPTQEKKNTSLFDSKPATSLTSGLFGQTSQPSTGASLFGAKAPEEKKDVSKTSLFPANQLTTQFGQSIPSGQIQSKQKLNIFGQKMDDKKQLVPEQKEEKKTGLFANNDEKSLGDIFSKVTTNNNQANELNVTFDKLPHQQQVKPSLFGSKDTKLPPNLQEKKGGLFALSSNESKGLFAQKSPQPDQKPISNMFAQQSKQVQAPKLFQQSSSLFNKQSKQTPGTTLIGQTTTPWNGLSLKVSKQQKGPVSQPLVSVSELKKEELVDQKTKKQKPESEKKIDFSQIRAKKPQPKTDKLLVEKKDQREVEKEKQKPSIVERKSDNLQKLKELGSLMGHTSIQKIPSPLRQLTEQQVDAIISSLKGMVKAPEPQHLLQKSREQLARQKLLKEQHFGKILEKIDETNNYLKTLKEANEVNTSPTMFTLNNVKRLLSQQPEIKQNTIEQLKTKNPLSTVVKNYTQRMEFLQKQYIHMDQESSHKRNHQNKQQRIQQTLEFLQECVSQLVYYQESIFSQNFGFFNKKLTTEQQEKKWIDITTKKNDSSSQLIQRVDKLFTMIETSSSSKLSSVKSNSVITNISAHSKKKGHFSFTLSSNSESDQEHERLPIQEKRNNNNYQLSNETTGTKRNILIKFKPKTINLAEETTDVVPLVKLAETATQPVYKQDDFNPVEMFKSATQANLISSKKSINFKDKIPMKRESNFEQPKIKKSIKFDQSQQLSNDSEQRDRFQNDNLQESEQEENVPGIGRTISKFNLPPTVSKQSANKGIPKSQSQEGLNIKKTFEKNVPEKVNLTNQVKQAAAVFGQAPTKVVKEDKKQAKKEQKPQQSNLFNNITNAAGMFGGNVQKTQAEKDKKEQKKIEGTLFGAPKVDQKPESKKQQKTGLFGKVQAPTGSLFGNLTKTQSKQGSKQTLTLNNQKSQQQKGEQSKTQPLKQEKKQTSNLFGIAATKKEPALNLFGTSTAPTHFKGVQQKSTDEQKKLDKTSKIVQPTLSAGQKVAAGDKSAVQADTSKEEKKPTSLFGDVTANKASLFGTTAPGLFNNLAQSKEQPKKTQKQGSAQNTAKGSLFGTKATGLLGATTGGNLFGQNAIKKPDETKQAGETRQVKSSEQVEKVTPPASSQSLFGLANVSKQKIAETSQAPKAQETAPTTTVTASTTQPPQPSTDIFGNTAASGTFANQAAGGAFGQQKQTHQVFGGQNRFMGQGTQQTQPVQSSSFNPNEASFGNTASFAPSENAGGFKSFATFGGNQSGNLFNQGQQNQPQNTNLFGQNQAQTPNLFGQNQPQNTGVPVSTNPLQPMSTQSQFSNQSTMFGNQQQNPLFGQQQGSSMFGSMTQPAQTGANFLSGFNPTGMNQPANTQNPQNPSMFKARK